VTTPPAQRASAPAEAEHPLRLLVVDDNPDDRALVLRTLRRELPRVEAQEIADAAALEQVLAGEPLDMVITDYQLLWSTGLDVLRAVKERWPDCPVVMFTATGNEEVAVEAMKSGLDDYVLKSTNRLPRLAASVRMALENAQRKRDLAAALRLREEFLTVAAHELKTPVTSLLGFAQVSLRRLRRGEELTTERMERVLATVAQQAERLARLVERLLDTTRLETGRLVLTRESADLVALAHRVAALVQGTTTRHTIAVQPAEGEAITAEVDSLRIEQVLTNLLENAVKFSFEGGAVEVVVTDDRRPTTDDGPLLFEEGGNDGGWVKVTVRDHGVGIPAERRNEVFGRFAQAHGDAHLSGIGLGLYVSRQLVELHGGTIEADSPAEGGTEVVVRLPKGREQVASSE
jgi:signal transduction histidine kinase